MTIYFLRAGESGRIKIGYTSNDVAHRMIELQVGCPFRLAAIGCIEGTPADESALHVKLAAHKTIGEWFTSHPEVLAAIDAALLAGKPVPISTRTRKRHDTPAGKIIDLLGGNAVVARMARTKPQNVSNWRKTGCFPPKTWFLIGDEIVKRGVTREPSLFRMRPAPAPDRSAA